VSIKADEGDAGGQAEESAPAEERSTGSIGVVTDPELTRLSQDAHRANEALIKRLERTKSSYPPVLTRLLLRMKSSASRASPNDNSEVGTNGVATCVKCSRIPTCACSQVESLQILTPGATSQSAIMAGRWRAGKRGWRFIDCLPGAAWQHPVFAMGVSALCGQRVGYFPKCPPNVAWKYRIDYTT